MFTISTTLPCRRNVAALTPGERAAFVGAVKALKAAGGYDPFVLDHVAAMAFATPSGTHPTTRNAAHRGPAFLPWHREFLRRLEDELRAFDPSVAIPYWDWATDEALPDPATGAVWSTDLLGGDGDATDGDVVKTGPFREGEWEIVDSGGTPSGPLVRQFGRSGDAVATGWTTLPTQVHLDGAMLTTPYDASPWHRSSNPSLRNELEGWVADGLHNRVHVWVGGAMLPDTSPNDPVFFLHHCMVDKVWADWQAAHPTEYYLPQSGGPAGHNVSDALYPWPTSPAAVLDHKRFHLYDTDPPEISLKPTTSLAFQDVPEGETTYRAAVFEVLTCTNLTIEVVPGPTAPFTVLQSTVVVNPGRDAVLGEARIWIGYTGTTDGDSASGSVTIRALGTGDEWILPITANTRARPTAAIVLALDQSGSMDSPSGVADFDRIDVLRYSAAPFVELIQEGNAIGIVRFDHDAYTTMAVTGPLGPPGAFDTDRPTARGHIATHTTNPAGLTAIGDALERAHDLLDLEPAYDVKATIVFTDGHETASKRISDVTGIINERVYAIGLGTPEQIQPGALMDLTNGSGGYVYLTGELNDDLYFRLAKYFLQVLAGVTNEDIVVDPQGWLKPGEKRRIPFDLSETDISSDMILLSPAPWAFRFWLENPAGETIDPSDTSSLPAVRFVSGQHSAYYRTTLPIPMPSGGAREGRWHAVLDVDERSWAKYLSSLDNDPEEARRVRAHGIRYSLNVHSYSNLRMNARLSQSGVVPGEMLYLRAVMTEYGLPMTARVEVNSELIQPDGSLAVIPLTETDAGVFEASLLASLAGVYTARVLAKGRTLRGRDFTREQTLTGAVWQGGNRPQPDPGGPGSEPDDRLCRLLECLLGRRDFVEYLRSRELPVDAIAECLKQVCRRSPSTEPHASPRDLLASRPDVRSALAVMARFLDEGSGQVVPRAE